MGEATQLRVLARTLDDGDMIVDRRVELEDGDCQPGGAAVFDVTVTPNGDVAIERAG